MLTSSGCHIVPYRSLTWVERERLPGWTNRTAIYYSDEQLAIRMVDQPKGASEPRHTHPGVHGTTILEGRAIIDGLTLRPRDALLGPSNEPHGPLEYPDGCKLLSCFQGSNDHSVAQGSTGEKHYRLIQSGPLPWQDCDAPGTQIKTLLEDGAGPLRLSLLRHAKGILPPCPRAKGLQARLVLEGSLVIEDRTLGVWDLFFIPAGLAHEPMSAPEGATLLAIEMR